MGRKSFSTTDMANNLPEYARYLREQKMQSARTVASYVQVLTDFRAFLEAEHVGIPVTLEAVGADALVRFLRKVSNGRGTPSPATWNARLAALRSFYTYLFVHELVEANPTRTIERQKVHLTEPIPLSPEEYFDLQDALSLASPAYRTRDQAIVSVLFHTGMRVAELVSLDLEQVDLRNHLLLDVRVKGNKRVTKRLNDLVAAELEVYLDTRERLADAEVATSALFLSDRGTRLSIRSVEELVSTYAKRAGISRRITPHVLRHSSASVLSDLGVPIPAIQRHLNHASARTTERYIHVRSPAEWVVNELGDHMKKLAKARKKGGGGRKQLRSRVAAYSASNPNSSRNRVVRRHRSPSQDAWRLNTECLGRWRNMI